MDRALPPLMIDLIRDGVPPAELRASGSRAVWRALFRTAASACQRGWDAWEWEQRVGEPASRLGAQARLRDGKKARTDKAYADTLHNAWDKATAWVSEQPRAFDREQMRELAQNKATALLVLASDPAADLLDADRAVLAYAAQQATERGTDRVAMARRTVAEVTGLGERSVRNALDRLDRSGLLTLAEAGRPGGPSAKRARAHLYRPAEPRDAAASLYRETRSVGPLDQLCGTPADGTVGTPPSSVGPPSPESHSQPKEGPHMVTLTLTAPDAEELASALALLRQERGVQVDTADAIRPSLPRDVLRMPPRDAA